MIWKEVTTPAELENYIEFEHESFSVEYWGRYEDYDNWIDTLGLKIHLLVDEQDENVIIGSFNVLVKGETAYMAGFAVNSGRRGFRLSRKLMNKLLKEYGKYQIICKTNPKDFKIRRVLSGYDFQNSIDKFENGKLWSYWSRNPN